MNTAFLRLESFEGDHIQENSGPIAPQDVESLRALSYEEGYGAGWTDALDQMRNEDALRRIAAEDALQAVAFSFHEACNALEGSFTEIVAQIIDTVLPDLMSEALRQVLERELRAVANRHFAARLELLCAPSVKEGLNRLLDNVPGLNIQILEEDSFSEAQVMIRVDQNQRMIDLGAVMGALKSGLGSTPNSKDISYG